MSSGRYVTAAPSTDQAVAELMQTFVERDDFWDKTWTRRVVEGYFSKRKWYFPMRDKPNGPDLSKAYAFYEHMTLPRYFSGEQESDTVRRKCERGESEEETRLFSPVTTKASSFIEWGIGMDLYFLSLKVVAFLLFLAGLLNWYNLRFFASSTYSENKAQTQLSVLLKGSAICTTFEWVACPNCTKLPVAKEKMGSAAFGLSEDGVNTTLVLRSDCDPHDHLLQVGMVNYATFFLLFFSLALFVIYLRARESRADESKMTAKDYSVVVVNPPPDAYDPDLWRDYFERYAEADKKVTCVTVAINNEQMLRKLVYRRIYRRNLSLMLPQGTDMEDEDLVLNLIARLEKEWEEEPRGIISKIIGSIISIFVLPILNLVGMFLPPMELFNRMVKLKEEIKELQKVKYQVTNVFVTFETEEGQRSALQALTVGWIDVMMNNTRAGGPGSVFQGHVLRVEDPTEPDSVRWLDLSTTMRTRLLARIINAVLTLGVVIVAGICVSAARNSYGPALSGPLVSIFNSIIPYFVKFLMIFEPHRTEGSFQTSLFLKITLFRWINTAILPKFTVPLTSTLTSASSDLLPSIIAIFFSELTITQALRALDLYGNFQKHYLAPRARTQEQMNFYFQGTPYTLGERYTDFTKVLFLCFFYSALLPSSFFFGCLILIAQHYVDKFCLMRIWAWSPSIGPELARFSRRYFFSTALLAYAIVSAYAWAQFPYDDLCTPDNSSSQNYNGTYTNVRVLNGTTLSKITVTQSSEVVFCDQSWTGAIASRFPPTPRIQPNTATWMRPSQETLSSVYGWTSLGCLIAFLVVLFGYSTFSFFKSIFRDSYVPTEAMQEIDFSSNPEIYAYVPQIKLPSFPVPLLACDIDRIDQALIGWNDSSRSYDFYNLIFDVPNDGMTRTQVIKCNTRGKTYIADTKEYRESVAGSRNGANPADTAEKSLEPIFSIIKHYPPSWMQKILDSERRDTKEGEVAKEGQNTEKFMYSI